MTARVIRDGLAAGVVAAVLSGIPSTAHALARGRPLLEATRAAGRLAAPDATGLRALVAAGGIHVALSLGWGVALSAVLPRGREVVGGAVAGLAIAGLDLGAGSRLLGRRGDAVRRLPQLPQVADHLAFGVTVGVVLRRVRDGGTAALPG